MASDHKQELLGEAIGPHLATEEGLDFLAGQATMDDIRSRLSFENPSAAQHLTQLLLKYMWEEISTRELQVELRTLFGSNGCLQDPSLQDKFSPFLTAPVTSESEQASAKRTICHLLGLVTQKRDLNRPSLEEGVQFQNDVEERFKAQPGKYEEFLRVGFGSWRDGKQRAETRATLMEILKGNEDLIQQFQEIWPERRTEVDRE